MISAHRALQCLFRRLLLLSLFLKGLLHGDGWRQVLRTEAEALQKLENAAVFFLKLCYYGSLFAGVVRELECGVKKKGRD